MYSAELHNKLSREMMKSEDVLTSNVFSFFKYTSRKIFLKNYIATLGLIVSDEEARTAIFRFWPTYADNTEPDLVIIVGKYYLLIEAKYLSGFGRASEKTDAQIVREIREGSLNAEEQHKEFKYITITADYYFEESKFHEVPSEFRDNFIWTNWQDVLSFLETSLQNQHAIEHGERLFCSDLCELLTDKNFRAFRGYSQISGMSIESVRQIYFSITHAKFRGDFIGFFESLSGLFSIQQRTEPIFFLRKNEYFDVESKTRISPAENIFYGGKYGR
jgi:hypothetical protein